MLPLPLYFSDEIQLLSAAQLLRGVKHTTLIDDQTLAESLRELITETPESTTDNTHLTPLSNSSFLIATPRVVTTEHANHRFNIYLKAIESCTKTGELTPRIAINPFDLHPNCSAEAASLVKEALLKKIIALATIAQGLSVDLLLSPPAEEQLECWLELCAQLLLEPTLEHAGVGIMLSASSKRLIPALGYLERCARDAAKSLPVCILDQHITSSKDWPFAHTSPKIAQPFTRGLNLLAACTYLASDNNQTLRPELLMIADEHPSALDSIADSNGWPIWRPEPPVAPNSEAAPTLDSPLEEYDAPCLLPGLTTVAEQFERLRSQVRGTRIDVAPVIGGKPITNGEPQERFSPAEIDDPIGTFTAGNEEQVRLAYAACSDAQPEWAALSPYERRIIVQEFASKLATQQAELALIYTRETGIPVRDALQEIQNALEILHTHQELTANVLTPVAIESATHSHLVPHPRGIVLHLPSWQQSLLHFIATTSAALLTGNAVIINPAKEASMTLARLFELLLKSGVPANLIAYIPGDPEQVGQYLLEDYRLDAVMCNGTPSTATAIQQRLSKRVGAPPLPLLTDTGGRHAIMISADQSPAQHLPTLIRALCAYSGQHPGALRILYLDEEVADAYEAALTQALQWVRITPPELRVSEVGPLINREQMDRAFLHIERYRSKGRAIAQASLGEQLLDGYFVPPTLLRAYTLDELQEALDGPILHLIRYSKQQLSRTIDEINRSGFAMALTLLSSDDEVIELARKRARVSELNINPPFLHPDSQQCPAAGIGLSGTARRPGTAEYLRAMLRYQSLTLGDEMNFPLN